MSRCHVITGSASGIGAAATALLRSAGDLVIGVDRHDADVIADLSTPAGRAAAVAEVLDRTGGTIDAVIACAGLSDPVGVTVSVNYFGVVEVLEGLRSALTRSASPRAVAVSSIAVAHGPDEDLVQACLAGDETAARALADGFEERGPGGGYVNYPSSKAALSRWIRRVAITPEWAGAGIALNAVAPGTVLTPMTAPLLADPAMAEVVDAAVPMPLGGHQSAESVAQLLIWLASPLNTAVTAQTIFVDGGAEASLRAEVPWP